MRRHCEIRHRKWKFPWVRSLYLIQDIFIQDQDLEFVETGSDLNNDTIQLPPFTVVQEPNFKWGEIEGHAFRCKIDLAYAEIVQWRRNVFKVPSGKVCKAFVAELGRLFRAYAENSPLEQVALKCVMTMPALLLQRPHQKAKTKEHVACLERRLESWVKGDIDILLHECRTVQSQLPNCPSSGRSESQIAHTFAKFTFEGKIRQAIRLLNDDCGGGRLGLVTPVSDSTGETRTVQDQMMEKHPHTQPLKMSAVVVEDQSTLNPHPILYEQINGSLIPSIAA
jgi:hypothetical protein